MDSRVSNYSFFFKDNRVCSVTNSSLQIQCWPPTEKAKKIIEMIRTELKNLQLTQNEVLKSDNFTGQDSLVILCNTK
jgi:hypothetical protein